MHKQPVVVTGPTGFIGRRLCARLRADGATVIAALRDPGRAGPWQHAVAVDLEAQDAIELPAGIDTVFHLGGRAHALSEVAQDDRTYHRINTRGTQRMLEAARRAGARAFVFFSSVKAVGEASDKSRPVDESWTAPPDTPYGRSKREAEELVLSGGYVPHPVVLRPCLVYGPEPKGNLQKMITAVRAGRFPPLPEVGNKRSMVHVDDVVSAALLCAQRAEAAGRTYILADALPFSTRQLLEWVSAAVGRSVPRWTVPWWTLAGLARAGDLIGRVRGRRFIFDSDALEKLTGSAWYSGERIMRELGWSPRRTLRESMPEIAGRGAAAEG